MKLISWLFSSFSALSLLTKRDISILIGNACDHFDTALYSFLAPVLAPIFFPHADPIVQIILAYSVLATSVVTRPIGVLIAGFVAKHYDPIFCLSYSLIGMAIATMIVGFLPVHQDIGWLAALSLILARIIKGIFAASENTIARMHIMDGKEKEIAAKASHFYESSTILGIILASLLATIVIYFKQSDVAWRCAFWLGGIALIVGFGLRRHKNDKELQEQLYHVRDRAIKSFSSFRILWQERINVFKVALTASLSYITYSVPFIFLNSFVPLVTTISLEEMMVLNTSFLIFDMLVVPIVGHWTLKFNNIKIMQTACVVLAITIFPLFYCLPGASLLFVTSLRVWIMFLGVVFLCPLNLWYKNLFSSKDQYLLVGMGNTLGASTIGRLTPAICLWLWYYSEMVLLPACYISLVAVAAALAVKTIHPKRVSQFQASQTL